MEIDYLTLLVLVFIFSFGITELIKRIAKRRKTKKCPNCGSCDTQKGHYNAGRNSRLQQANGASGIYCHSCVTVTLDKA